MLERNSRGVLRTNQAGFTLIELMVTIAIVAILVTLAVPAYKDYAIRAKVAECVNHAAVAKVQISEAYQSLGGWPGSATDAAIDNGNGTSLFCSGFSNYAAGSGAFSVDVNELNVDPSIIGEIQPRLTPTVNTSGAVDWDCSLGGTAIGNIKYLPSTCRGT